MPIYRDIYDGPARNRGGRTNKRYVVIHNTSNDATAEQEASYAKRRTDGVSSHYYVDNNSIVQSLDTDLRANHVGSSAGNNGGISYEITGVNGWTRSQWLARVAWPLLAHAIRRDCAEHNIVPRELSINQIRAGSMSGIITHNQARLAWGGTTHTDPGPNFPMDHLISLVRNEEEGDMPTAKEIAAAVYERLSHEVGPDETAVRLGLHRPGKPIRPEKGIEYSWGYAKDARRRVIAQAGDLAALRTELTALRELVTAGAGLTDEQVAQLGDRIAAASAGAAAEVLERLEAAGDALTDDDDG